MFNPLHKKATLLAIVMAGFLVTSCQNPKQPKTDLPLASSSLYDAYIEKAAGSEKDSLLIYKADSLLKENNLVEAETTLNLVSNNLSESNTVHLLITKAGLYAKKGNRSEAANLLNSIDKNNLNEYALYRYFEIKVQTVNQQVSVDLLRAYIDLGQVTPPSEQQKIVNETWSVVANLSNQEIKNSIVNTNEFILQGWFELRTIYDTYRHDKQNTALFDVAIDNWRTRNPQHPASATFPSQFLNPGQYSAHSMSYDNSVATGAKVALALPFTGQAQVMSFANAIKTGFETTDIDSGMTLANQQTYSIIDELLPSQAASYNESASISSITFNTTPIDTQGKNIETILSAATDAGIETVVGPLLKNEVEQLSNYQGSLKILALNVPETLTSNPNVCYFALSPEDEAKDAATFMHSEGKTHPMLLVPYGNLGDRIASAFNQTWTQLTGSPAIVKTIHNINDLKIMGANSDALDIKGPIRNNAVDSLYVIAEADKWLYLKPMIDSATSGKKNIGIYTSSRSHQNSSGANFRLEMQGVKFSEIPLLANPNTTSYRMAMDLMQNDYSQVRLLAMGIDANRLVQNFNALSTSSNFTMPGATGYLSVGPNCEIMRKMTWLEYDNGVIIPARNTVESTELSSQ